MKDFRKFKVLEKAHELENITVTDFENLSARVIEVKKMIASLILKLRTDS